MQRLTFAILAITCVASAIVIPLNKIEPLPLQNNMRRDHTVNLGGSVASLGEFYATITLGTPPQTLNVQMDTGSSDLLVFGRLCTDCASNVTYAAIHSTSYTAVPCGESGYHCPTCGTFLNNKDVCSFSDYYGDGSGVQGSVLVDILDFGDVGGVNVSFGYIMNSSKGFERNPVDGIWGISYPDLGITTPALFSLFKEADIYEGFSMCLMAPGGDVAASMTLGEPQNDLSDFQFTKIIQEQYYNIKITDIQVDGTSIGAHSNDLSPAIVDSGTTLILLDSNAFTALEDVFTQSSFCQNATQDCEALFNGSCVNGVQLDQLPVLSFVLDGTKPLQVPASVYMIEQQGYYCLGVANIGGASGNGPVAILGDTFMGAFNVFFDIQNSRLGFADPSTCPQ